uniref:Uncharacterized protein n=1 Tax=Branchiostoma floridae TaxID=7739 RepID=C3Y341_BRAFL|eukprot:XP_002609443.1 hypothetical protein BRAFLDRAFT_93484 [Branchiostoma floridae]
MVRNPTTPTAWYGIVIIDEATTVSRRSVIPDGVNMASKDTGIKKTVAEKTAVQGQKTGGDKTKDAGRRNVSSSKVQSLHNLRNQTERTFRRKNLTNSAGKGIEEEEDRIGKLLGRLDRTLDGLKATNVVTGVVDKKGVQAGSFGTTQKQTEQTSSANTGKGGLESALAGVLHGPTIKGDKASKEKAPIVGPGGIPSEEVRWGSEYVTMKQGDATMQSAAPTQAAATIKSADTTQSAPPPGPGLSAALEGMLHGPTIKGDKASKEKAPNCRSRWHPLGRSEVGLRVCHHETRCCDNAVSSSNPGSSHHQISRYHTICTASRKSPIVGPGGIPKEEVRWGSEYVTRNKVLQQCSQQLQHKQQPPSNQQIPHNLHRHRVLGCQLP